MDMTKHTGGCHCGSVRFEFEGPAVIEALDCNCSICAKSGFLHYFIPRNELNILQGKDALTTYTFNTGVAQHYFCKVCGVKSFYIPRSHPDQYSVNMRCVDPDTLAGLHISPFDGQQWEQNVESIRD